jgi:hypothetical protein
MGFYKFENEELFIAPNFVIFPDGNELDSFLHETYTYPFNDWYWFDSEEEAKLFFGIES